MKAFKDMFASRKGRISKSDSSCDASGFKSTSPPMIVSPSTILMVSTPMSSGKTSPLPMPRVGSPLSLPFDEWQARIYSLERENERLRRDAVTREEDFKKLQRSYNVLLRIKVAVPAKRIVKKQSSRKFNIYQDKKSSPSGRFVSRIPVRIPSRPAPSSRLVSPLRLDKKSMSTTPSPNYTPAPSRLCTPPHELITPTPAARSRAVSAKSSISSIKRSRAHTKAPPPPLSTLPCLSNVPVSVSTPEKRLDGKENGGRPVWV